MEIYSWYKNKSNTNSLQQGNKGNLNHSEILNVNMWPKAQVKATMLMIRKQESIELTVDNKDKNIDFIQKTI